MKVDFIQTSFAAGEIGPSLYGRTDIAQYANACQIVENMLPRSYGSIISMPGTKYVATVSSSTLRTRLIPFIFNKNDAYVIEAGDLYMRFYTNRGQVVDQTGTEDLSSISDLVSQWKCNDNTNSTTVLDGTGSHSGTASTLTSTLSTTGVIGNAFDLKGLYYVSVADHIDFTRTAATQPMSVVLWFYYEDYAGYQCLFSKMSATGSNEYQLYTNAYKYMAFSIYDYTTAPPVEAHRQWRTTNPLSVGWNFVVITFKGDGTGDSDCKMYVNGVIVDSTAYNLTGTFTKMANTVAPFCIGAQGTGGLKFQSK